MRQQGGGQAHNPAGETCGTFVIWEAMHDVLLPSQSLTAAQGSVRMNLPVL